MSKLYLIDEKTRDAVLQILNELPTGPIPFKIVAQAVMNLQSLPPAPTPAPVAAPAPHKEAAESA
jgi:hypothetical protein